MDYFIGWGLLLAVFVGAGEGLNLFRVYIVNWLADGKLSDGVVALLGLLLAFGCTAFLVGFVYYRDKKRGKLKREGWRGRPIKRQRPQRQVDPSKHD